MGRSRWCCNLKHHSFSSRSTKDMNGKKLKDNSLDFKNTDNQCNTGGGRDILAEFPWPPRCYTCSFCKREFKSAQALGGHMNVHRRDRARLRQSPPNPLLNLNLDPNPDLNLIPNNNPYNYELLNPNPSILVPSISTLENIPTFGNPTLPQIFLPSDHPFVSSASVTEIKRWGKDALLVNDHSSTIAADSVKVKPRKSISWGRDENFSPFVQEKVGEFVEKSENIVSSDLERGRISEPDEDLDLELRLGYLY